MFPQVSRSEDVGSVVSVSEEEEVQAENYSDALDVLGTSRVHILAAQFECYLKIISDPPRAEEGDRAAASVVFFVTSL